jgi:hypothetical protein
MRFCAVLVAFSYATLASAQPAVVKVPGLGFAWDGRSNQIRPIHGIPGAAVLGEGTGNTGFASISISPRHDLALAVSAIDGRVQLVRPSSGDAQDLPELAAAPSRLIFSPSGTAALAAGSRLQILTGLPDAPSVQELAIPPDSGMPTALAISDDTQLVILSTGSGDTASTWLLAPGFAPVSLSVPGALAAAAFRPGSRDAVALGSDGAVYRILNSSFPGEVAPVISAEERTANPVAVRVSADGRNAYSANRIGTLAKIDLFAASLETIQCGCVPTTIEPLTSSDLYRINDISDRPVMLFDVSTSTARVWFVPADSPLADSKRSGQ